MSYTAVHPRILITSELLQTILDPSKTGNMSGYTDKVSELLELSFECQYAGGQVTGF